MKRENVGQAMEFVVSAHDPSKHFGLPKKVWKEVRFDALRLVSRCSLCFCFRV